ncbi:MAG: hypothetical protein ACI9MC_001971 [Kiritimatiellia bacterium]|jgi:hypothetical protein
MKSKRQAKSSPTSEVAEASESTGPSESNADVPQDMPGNASNGLPPTLMASMEELGGVGLSDVEVHRNSDKPSEIGAHAYAQGSDIHLSQGPEDSLPHEAWHVVQQRQGRVTPTTQVGDNGVNSSPGLEAEADAMGAAAASGSKASASGAASNVIQRDEHEDLDAGVSLAHAVNAMFADGASAVPNKGGGLASPLTGSSDKRISGLAKVINGGNSSIFGTRKDQISEMAEALFKTKASGLEAKDGGHSLDRHGPQVTDTPLQDRLKTGDAPDGAFSPAPGLSTRFSDHGAYLKSRVLAGAGL